MAFVNACSEGVLNKVIKLYDEKLFFQGIIAASSNDRLTVVKELFKKNSEAQKYLEDMLIQCCIHGSIKVCKFLYSECYSIINYRAFELCVEFGHFEMAEWIYNEIDIDEYIVEELLSDDLVRAKFIHRLLGQTDKEFVISCANGYMKVAKWLFKMGADIYHDNNKAFELCCAGGHIELATWLYPIYENINIDDAFVSSCKNGQIEIVSWLNILGDISDVILDAFYASCEFDKVIIFNFLYDLYVDFIECSQFYYVACKYGSNGIIKRFLDMHLNKVINLDLEHGFAISCKQGHQDTVKILYQYVTDPTKGMIAACQNGHLDIMKVMHHYTIPGYGAYIYSIDHLDIVKWLYEKDNKKYRNVIVGSKLDVPNQIVKLFEHIKERRKFPPIEHIDDCVIYTLIHYGMTDHLIKLSKQFKSVSTLLGFNKKLTI